MMIHCAHDALVKTKDLKPHPQNRNKHPKEQIERLAKILEYQGWRYPIKVSKRSGCITSGHGRLEAARHLGWKEVPVNFQDYTDDAQEYADVQSDNAIASWAELDLSGINSDIADLGPDFDLDLLGIKDFVLEPVEKLEPQCDEDEVPDALPEPKVVRGEVYILGKHRLMCGDSTALTDVDRLLDSRKVDLVFTDPPYGIGYQDVAKNHRKIENDSALDGIQTLLTVLLSFNCPMFICCNWKCYSTFEKAMIESDRSPKACIVWDKGSRVQNLDKFGKQHEFILYWGPFGGERTVDVDVWQCKREVIADHPTAKPTELVKRAIGHFKGKVILDLFGGSGSTLIACEALGRSAHIMELDAQYCGVILDRWQKYTGRKAHREDGVAWDEIKAGVTHGAAS